MNVFEFLGLPATHRADNKVVQLVKHFDDVNKRASEGIYHKQVSFPMFAQCKKDGVFAMLVVYNKLIRVFGRTGKELNSCHYIIANANKLTDGVYLAELCSDDCSLEVLSGIVNPNRVNELDHAQSLISKGMKLYYHDYLTIEEFIEGISSKNYSARYSILNDMLPLDSNILGLEQVSDETELRRFADRMIDNGQEGAVFKQNVGWLAGAKDWHSMKIVRGVSYDLECIGYEEGTGKYEGLVANLLFRWKDDKVVKAMLGKGWTHQDAMSMFNCIKRGHTGNESGYHLFSQPIGKIFEVYALQESSKGVLRLPKVGELRHDKCKPDF